jgi:hypothetical protein
MKQRHTVQVAGPFSIDALIETHLGTEGTVLGYNIRGPGQDPYWLYSEDELAAKLDELLTKLHNEKGAA